MANSNEGRSVAPGGSRPSEPVADPPQAEPLERQAAIPEPQPIKNLNPPTPAPAGASARSSRARTWRKRLPQLAGAALVVAGGFPLAPIIQTALNTVSTDDAYVNGHVTFVAPRVAGQVKSVLERTPGVAARKI